MRLNDYDFGEGTVPTVTYTTLPQFIYGVTSTASATFPKAENQPFNFLNLDLYAQGTWRLTSRLTWTFGIRDSFNSNPLNPHRDVVRLPESFTSISHDVNQPIPLSEHVKLRLEGQFFNVFNHPNFALPSIVLAGSPGNLGTQTGFGALAATTSPPTGLLGVGLGGDNSPRMIAFHARIEC